MDSQRTVVITGASRGLGLAAAVRLYCSGWRVIATMRSVDAGMARLSETIGYSPEASRMVGVRLDLTDSASVHDAASTILRDVGPPDVLVHNAGISAVGHAEETPLDAWDRMFATHVLGPVSLTNALLPSMRARARGRIICVSSVAAQYGMPASSAYSATKSAMERWAESLANEISPFGLGVTVLIAGTFDTEIITEAGASDYRDLTSAYERSGRALERLEVLAARYAAPPEKFAKVLERTCHDTTPFRRRIVGTDARALTALTRLLPASQLHTLLNRGLRLPRTNELAHGEPR